MLFMFATMAGLLYAQHALQKRDAEAEWRRKLPMIEAELDRELARLDREMAHENASLDRELQKLLRKHKRLCEQ